MPRRSRSLRSFRSLRSRAWGRSLPRRSRSRSRSLRRSLRSWGRSLRASTGRRSPDSFPPAESGTAVSGEPGRSPPSGRRFLKSGRWDRGLTPVSGPDVATSTGAAPSGAAGCSTRWPRDALRSRKRSPGRGLPFASVAEAAAGAASAAASVGVSVGAEANKPADSGSVAPRLRPPFAGRPSFFSGVAPAPAGGAEMDFWALRWTAWPSKIP